MPNAGVGQGHLDDGTASALQPFVPRRDNMQTISLTASMASSWLGAALADFLVRHPQIEINLLSDKHLVHFERQPQVDAPLRICRGQRPGVAASAEDGVVALSGGSATLGRAWRFPAFCDWLRGQAGAHLQRM
ncbi:hypothetical protein K8O61_02335 [Xanthomonas cerealis pv. cerealis]|nr:hypothetical protein [Xanthomonas translucens]UKE69928.1 hypothetical protein K8O61_02335 [Xanthomonas translucens pv. pistacia]